MAIPIPLTVKPEIKASAMLIIIALIISKNNPKVKTVIGKVNTIKIGFTNKFKILKINATHTAVPKLATATPGNKFAINTTAKAFTNN